MKKGMVVSGIFAVFAVVLGLILYIWKPVTKTEPEYVLLYAENQAEDYPTTMGAYRFAELVEQRTRGRIQILVQPNGRLGAEKDILEQMRFGGVDFSRVSLSQLAEVIPELNVLQLPYLYNDADHMWKILDGEIGDHFLSLVNEDNMVGLSWYDAGARSFYTSDRTITCLEDVNGMKIRVQESKMMMDMVSALGGIPDPIPYAEVYGSIQKKEVDGAENNWPSYESMGHYEVARYFTEDEHTRVPEMQICSSITWNQFSTEDQTIIRQCAAESALYEKQLWIEREKESKEIAVENGVEVITLSFDEKKKFQAAVQDIYPKYCGDYMDIINKIIALGNE